MPELTICPLFDHGCVLQADQSNCIWGTAPADATVTVSCETGSWSTEADADGHWLLTIDPLPASGPYAFKLSDSSGNSQQINDVLSGEVWICSGQSNMEWNLGQLPNLVYLREEPTPQIRYFRQRGDYHLEPQTTTAGTWRSTDGREAGECSAVAMAFARALQAKLNRPIGLIVNAIGGTFIESWIPREVVLATPGGQARKDKASTRQQEVLQHLDKRKNSVVDWVSEAKADTNDAPVWRRPPLDDLNPGWISGNQIGACYNTFIHPLRQLSCAGVIWYQGESNADLPEFYADLYNCMLDSWRAHLAKDSLPFYSVQLASWQSQEEEEQGLAGVPREDGFPGLRQAQTATTSIPHTGLASAIDVGHKYDIHPLDKDVVGERLARLALNRTYHQPCVDTGPSITSAQQTDDGIRVRFDQPIVAHHDPNAVPGFFIRTAASEWTACTGTVDEGSILLFTPKTDSIAEVSYAECGFQETDLFNTDGLPAFPGRVSVEA